MLLAFLVINIICFIIGITHHSNTFDAAEDQDVDVMLVDHERVKASSHQDKSLDNLHAECNCPKLEKPTCPPVTGNSPKDKSKQPDVPQKIGEDFNINDEFQVPNIVHYIWYNTKPSPFRFHHMLSVMSASKFLNPEVIYFHTDNEPTGEFWDRTKSLPKLKINKRDPPLKLYGEDVKPPHFYTSHSNVDRVKVLMEYGGIYLDFDVFVIRSFDELRKKVCTVGLESDKKACGSVIVCSKDAFFLRLWINSYLDDYQMDEWAYNTGQVPFNLARRFPELVSVEKTKINRPNFKELDTLWGDKTFNWRENYAVHTWYRLWKEWSGMFKGVEPDPENIKTLNNTFGQIARTILYGSSDFVLK